VPPRHDLHEALRPLRKQLRYLVEALGLPCTDSLFESPNLKASSNDAVSASKPVQQRPMTEFKNLPEPIVVVGGVSIGAGSPSRPTQSADTKKKRKRAPRKRQRTSTATRNSKQPSSCKQAVPEQHLPVPSSPPSYETLASEEPVSSRAANDPTRASPSAHAASSKDLALQCSSTSSNVNEIEQLQPPCVVQEPEAQPTAAENEKLQPPCVVQEPEAQPTTTENEQLQPPCVVQEPEAQSTTTEYPEAECNTPPSEPVCTIAPISTAGQAESPLALAWADAVYTAHRTDITEYERAKMLQAAFRELRALVHSPLHELIQQIMIQTRQTALH
jgi:hypothetical protein